MSFFRQFPKIQYDFQNNGIDTRIIDIFRFVKADDRYLDDLSTYAFYQIQNGDRPDIVSNLLYGTPDYYWTFFVINEQLKTGLSGWPMSTEQFDDYMTTEYDGIAIETYPVIIRDGDGRIEEHRNSFAERFQLNETVTGILSGATGIVKAIDVQKSQLILRDVDGVFQENELVRGNTTLDEVTSYRVWDYRDAPHHYEDDDGNTIYSALHIDEQYIYDANNVLVTASNPIQTGTSDSEVNIITNLEYETQLNDERANIRVIRPKLIYDFAKNYRDLINI